jgi:hypothetical protein
MVASAALLDNEPSDGCLPTGDLLSMPALQSTQTVLDVKVSSDLSTEQGSEVMQLLSKYPDVLSDMPGRTSLGEHEIKLTTNDPVRLKPYPISHALKDTVRTELQSMKQLGVIEASTSAYSSPIVMVKKSDGSIRFCIDFRALNRITVFDAEPLPDPEEIFATLASDKYFSKVDLTKGYWQIPLKLESRPATAFSTPDGLYQFCTMPFGLVNAPASFSRMMRSVLRGLKNTHNFVDDILVHTADWGEHLAALDELLGRLRDANLTAKPSKCEVGFRSLEFLGHMVGEGQMKPKVDKVEMVREAKRPETKKQLRSFLGLVGYYRRFIPNFAAIAVPLTDLTKKREPDRVTWGESQEHSFKTLKALMTSSPILQLPECTKPFVLRTDASNAGLGAVLLQHQGDDVFPVAYASRKLLPREQAYATIEKECLAMIWGIKKFDQYLYGREFTLQTDHQSLIYINRTKMNNARVMRWALALQSYRFRIESIKGTDNVGADYLSRVS